MSNIIRKLEPILLAILFVELVILDVVVCCNWYRATCQVSRLQDDNAYIYSNLSEHMTLYWDAWAENQHLKVEKECLQAELDELRRAR